MVQREVQCQAAAQTNKPLFIWKRMLFVSDDSLLESLLSIAVDVLLPGPFHYATDTLGYDTREVHY